MRRFYRRVLCWWFGHDVFLADFNCGDLERFYFEVEDYPCDKCGVHFNALVHGPSNSRYQQCLRLARYWFVIRWRKPVKDIPCEFCGNEPCDYSTDDCIPF